jgi:tRNA dimethylallyltransferase
MNSLVAVIGPTAAGKSQLALQLARTFQGEIVNADSRQVYRYMDIGTAKPSNYEQKLIKHHLLDLINPDESFSLALYQKLAFKAIKDIQRRNKLPLLVGGSGLYVWSVLEGWRIPPVPPNNEFRELLEKTAREKGNQTLFQELIEIDPVAASKIMPGNLRRVIRALEIYRKTGVPASTYWRKQPPRYRILIVGLTMRREDLYRRIDARVEEMIKRGFVEDVRSLLEMGYTPDLPSMSGIGYKQVAAFIEGQLDLAGAIEQIKKETHRFARRQYAWFKLTDTRIHWLSDYGDFPIKATKLLESFLADASSKEEY